MPEAEGFPQRVHPHKLAVEVLRLDIKSMRTCYWTDIEKCKDTQKSSNY